MTKANELSPHDLSSKDLSSRDLRIGPFLVQPALLRIVSEQATLQVEPKSMAVLVTLASRPRQVVTRQELFDAVWPQESVTDDVLTRAIAELRKRFGDSAGRPEFIETIRGRGYRLIAPVYLEEAGHASPDVSNRTARRPPSSGSTSSDGPPSRARISAGSAVLLFGLTAVITASLRFSEPPPPEPAQVTPPRPLQIRPLTGATEKDRDPDVSPSGTSVAYSQIDSETGHSHIFLKLHDVGHPLQLTFGSHTDRLPVFSPDGTRLSFARLESGQCGIFQVAATGGPVRRLADCPPGRHLRMAWSPDGRYLARAESMAQRSIGLVLLDVETLETTPLTQPPADSVDNEPTFSPDGKWVAFNRSEFGGVSDLYAVRLEDREERRLTQDFRDISGQAWTDNPEQIIFSSDRAGIHSLWRVDLTAGEPQWLAGGGNKIKHPAHARHAEVVAFEEWQYEINLWRFDLSTGQGTEPVVQSTAWDIQPSFSPDGEHLSFTSTRTGSHELWLAKADGSEPMQLTSLSSGYIGQAAWSPNSRSLVFPAHADGQTDLYRFDLGSVVPVQLTDDAGQEIAPSWSANGTDLYFGADRGQGFQIWRLPLDTTGSPKPIAVAQGSVAAESPDGRTIYLARLDDDRLWRLENSRTGAAGAPSRPQRTDVKVGFGRRHSWQVDSTGLLFLSRGLQQWEVKRLDLRGEQPVTISNSPRFGRPEFTVSPDGRFLVYARTDRAECDILIARNFPSEG